MTQPTPSTRPGRDPAVAAEGPVTTATAPVPAPEPPLQGPVVAPQPTAPPASVQASPPAQPPPPKPPPKPQAEPEGEKTMTFWEHLDELRKRLIKSVVAFFVGCFAAWEIRTHLLSFLFKPYGEQWRAHNLPGEPTLHIQSPGAAFTGYLQLSMLGGVAIAAPFIFYQLWAFIAPGLYSREKKYVIPFVFLSSLLFVGGGYFGWRLAFPITFDYFIGLTGTVAQGEMQLMPTIMMSEYLDFVIRMLLAFGVIFELPLLLLFLSIAGIVNYLQLIRFGRWFVLVAFIVAAIFTPPDATSQVLMAAPMIILYFVSIGLAYLFGKPPTEDQREAYRRSKKKGNAGEASDDPKKKDGEQKNAQ